MEENKVILPSWYKDDLLKKFKARIAREFILYGNINDLIIHPDPVARKAKPYLTLNEFLECMLVSSGREVVVFYNISDGFTFANARMEQLFNQLTEIDRLDPNQRTAQFNDSTSCLKLLEKALKNGSKIGVVITSAQTIVPNTGGNAMMPLPDRQAVERLKRWADNPKIKEHGNVVVLITDLLSEINADLRKSGIGIESIMLPPPDRAEREAFIQSLMPTGLELEKALVAAQGLNLRQLQEIFALAAVSGQPLTPAEIFARKNEILSKEFGDVTEFEDPLPFADIGGLVKVKCRLSRYILHMREGRIHKVPQGILLCGPPGTGKTLLGRGAAHEAGFPCLIWKNTRDKYLGVTEAQTEKQLYCTFACAPCIVINDEADLNDATRGGDNDSGVSERIMGMRMKFLANTKIRGKVLVLHMTNRPDRIDAALKRPGRMDERWHIDVPAPEARRQIFAISCRKRGIKTSMTDFSELAALTDELSGAHIDNFCRTAEEHADSLEKTVVDIDDFRFAINDRIPDASQKENDEMTLNSILECSSKKMLEDNINDRIMTIIRRGLVDDLGSYLERLIGRGIFVPPEGKSEQKDEAPAAAVQQPPAEVIVEQSPVEQTQPNGESHAEK